MNKKFTAFFSVLIVIAFIAFIIYDSSTPENTEKEAKATRFDDGLEENWIIASSVSAGEGSLKAVAVAKNGKVYAGGASFISAFDSSLKQLWKTNTPEPVTALCTSGDTIFAATAELVLVIGKEGKILEEWGPFEGKSFITSITANGSHVVYADAGNKMVVVLDRKGGVERIIGQNDGQFVLPSPYFDVALDRAGNFCAANTGHRRIETHAISGKLLSMFGEPGLEPGSFAGCCNPAHFSLLPDGFVTAEKGLNRIKILNSDGKFREFVSVKNKFIPSVPLDLAALDGRTIYAANPSDSKIYKFVRK
jgi:hypothetical protein